LALIQPVYCKPNAKGWRRPFPLEVMLRIHILQQRFTLSDPLMEEMLIDTPVSALESVNQSLSEKGVMLKEGRILDTTIINAPGSTKNKKGERDPERHSVAKGNQWFFGMGC